MILLRFKLFLVFAITFSSIWSLSAMRGSPFWEKDAEVDKDKWALQDMRGKKRKDKARSALNDAVVMNHYEIVCLLIDKGADVNAKEKSGWTALHWAIHYNRVKIAKYLIDQGADVNAKTEDGYGWTPLTLALRDDLVDLAKILIQKGANVKTKTNGGKTALSMALKEKHPELAKLMIEKNIFIGGCPRSNCYPIVIANRGYSANYPENTLPAIEAAEKAGAVVMNLDIERSRDGEIVVLRNQIMEKLTDDKKNANKLELEEILKLDAGNWKDESFKNTRVPTLKQVLKLSKNRYMIMLNIPSDLTSGSNDFEAKLVDLITDNGLINAVIVASENYQLLRNLRNRSKDIQLALKSRQEDPHIDIINLLKTIKAVSYNPEWRTVDKKLVTKLHKAGYLIFPWSAVEDDDTLETMKKMNELDVDGFYTNNPELLKSVFISSTSTKSTTN